MLRDHPANERESPSPAVPRSVRIRRMKTTFIGLGNMGLPMARNLLQAGHALVVYNRTPARAQMLKPRGAIHISMSTISPALSRRLSERHRASGQTYVAAPVFGRPEAAEAKKLWVVAAGPPDALERCRPVLDAMGQGVIVAGDDPVRANVIKVAGNFLLAAAIEAMGEAFALTRKYGVAPAELLDIVNGRLFRSPIYENYGKLIAEERYEPAGFKLKYGLKDVRLALGAADEVAAPLPLASLIRDRYLSGVARGWGDIDWAGLARIAAADAGLSPPRSPG